MEDGWKSDIAPANGTTPIGIPAIEPTVPAPMITDDNPYGASDVRRTRSRSPGREDRGRRTEGVNPGNNLHVSGLHHKVDSRELENTFAKIGRVQKAQIMYDPHTQESRGFGFVTMESSEEGDAAITALNATEFMGKTMNVQKARRARGRTPTPGRYYGPPKRTPAGDRPYDPRPYDSRYNRDNDDRRRGGGGGGGGRYDDRDRRDTRDHDRYDRYADRDRYERRGGGGGGGGGYDDRRY